MTADMCHVQQKAAWRESSKWHGEQPKKLCALAHFARARAHARACALSAF